MDNKSTPKTFEEREKERLEEAQKREQRMTELRLETRKWFESDPNIAAYFDKYQPSSVEHFFDEYAFTKSLYLEYGDNFGSYKENHDLRHLETTPIR